MLLRDSINPFEISLDNLSAVAGYGDGEFVWSSAGWARFPSSIVPLVIVVSALHSGDILDVENGDATPGDVPGWVQRFKRVSRRAATIYCSRTTWPLVIAALQSAGINPLSVDYWIATLDGSQQVSVPNGGKQPVAIQYIDTGPYDESVILDPTWIGGNLALDFNDPVIVDIRQTLTRILSMLADGHQSMLDANGNLVAVPADWPEWLPNTLGQIQSSIPSSGSALTTQQAQQLSDLAAAVTRIESSLKAA